MRVNSLDPPTCVSGVDLVRGSRAGAKGEGIAMSNKNANAGAAGGGAIYGLGIFGAWFYFFGQADSFWEYVWAFFQGLLWPAFMVYEVFTTLGG